MRTYKLVFTSSSLIDKLPDSQTIFGAVCNVIKATLGNDNLIEYLNSFSSEPWFVHSSMFIEGVFPSIKRNIFDLITVNRTISNQLPEDKLRVLSNFKKYKKINGISEYIFKEYVCSNKLDSLTTDLVNGNLVADDYNILKGIDEAFKKTNKLIEKTYRVRLDGVGEKEEEGKLFTNRIIFYPKDTKYVIYVKTNRDEQQIIDIFKIFNYFALGSKGSIGRNLFKFEKCEKVDYSSSNNYKMLLSKYIPNGEEFVINKSNYSLSLNNYIGGIKKKKLLGSFNHFEEGSLLYFSEKKEFYGKLIEMKQERETIYHYGIGFVV